MDRKALIQGLKAHIVTELSKAYGYAGVAVVGCDRIVINSGAGAVDLRVTIEDLTPVEQEAEHGS